MNINNVFSLGDYLDCSVFDIKVEISDDDVDLAGGIEKRETPVAAALQGRTITEGLGYVKNRAFSACDRIQSSLTRMSAAVGAMFEKLQRCVSGILWSKPQDCAEENAKNDVLYRYEMVEMPAATSAFPLVQGCAGRTISESSAGIKQHAFAATTLPEKYTMEFCGFQMGFNCTTTESEVDGVRTKKTVVKIIFGWGVKTTIGPQTKISDSAVPSAQLRGSSMPALPCAPQSVRIEVID